MSEITARGTGAINSLCQHYNAARLAVVQYSQEVVGRINVRIFHHLHWPIPKTVALVRLALTHILACTNINQADVAVVWAGSCVSWHMRGLHFYFSICMNAGH